MFTTVDVFALIKNKYILKIYCLSPCVTVTLVIPQNLVAWKKAKFGFDVFSGLLTLTFEPETYAAYFQGLSLNVFYLQGYFNKIWQIRFMQDCSADGEITYLFACTIP